MNTPSTSESFSGPFYGPLLAQVALTMLVWCWMYVTRLASMIRNRVGIEDLRMDAGYEKIRDAENPSDNLINLFEIPILFYTLMVILIHTGNTDEPLLWAAWIFVGGRGVHSLIHCTINVITLRFLAYFVSTAALFWMWFRVGSMIMRD